MSDLEGVAGYFIASLLFIIAIVGFISFRSALRVIKDLLLHMGKAKTNMENLPQAVNAALWLPVCVGVIGSRFQIRASETEEEYNNHDEARKWIVRNTFDHDRLAKRFLEESRFMKEGYDYKTALPPALPYADQALPQPVQKKPAEVKTDVAKPAEINP